ncbi:hypothetical protein PVAP13_4NG084100 [Panicum virgatum]|uniref:Uncharacterized protein n=1 Tax=Panicum virgatum TaxID=38727 RepID=A0A8T0T8K9_PANVG|nr:hypothetical protein PVAP13_4NG084100 [Panicum virgatum]
MIRLPDHDSATRVRGSLATPIHSCRRCGTFVRTLAGEWHPWKGSFDLRIIEKNSRPPEGYESGLVAAVVASVTFERVSSGGGDPQQVACYRFLFVPHVNRY